MRAYEWIVVAYFLYLAIAALVSRRRRTSFTALVAAAVPLGLVWIGDAPYALALRDWAPIAYLLAGYWLPARLVMPCNQRVEQWLLAVDHRWLIRRGVQFADRAPRVVIELLEAAYLACYPLVPAGFACLSIAGLSDETDRFWTAVLLAAFSCYGVLPWLPTRPPRALEPPLRRRSVFRALNLRVTGAASVHLNTFPSGHVATALAIALALTGRLPLAALAFGLIALGIAAASVVGRYHYAVDALSGALVALLAFGISRLVSIHFHPDASIVFTLTSGGGAWLSI
jgi:membrane-associated phospholipid phosphatase